MSQGIFSFLSSPFPFLFHPVLSFFLGPFLQILLFPTSFLTPFVPCLLILLSFLTLLSLSLLWCPFFFLPALLHSIIPSLLSSFVDFSFLIYSILPSSITCSFLPSFPLFSSFLSYFFLPPSSLASSFSLEYSFLP